MGLYYPGRSLYINGFDLQTLPGVVIQTIDPGQIPKRTLEAYKKSRAAGEVLVSAFFDYRDIVIKGAITGVSRTTYEATRDTLMTYVGQANLTLQTNIAGAQRYWVATMSDTSKLPEIFGGYASFELHFYAYDPFGYAVATTTNALGTCTTSGQIFTSTFTGSWNARPSITLTLNSFTGTGSQTITITNYLTGQYGQVTRVWSTSDVLVMDCLHNTCTVNGIQVPWSGVLPVTDFAPGAAQIQISDTFSARNITVADSYQARYI